LRDSTDTEKDVFDKYIENIGLGGNDVLEQHEYKNPILDLKSAIKGL